MYCNEHVSRITSQKSQKFARILQHNSMNHTHSLENWMYDSESQFGSPYLEKNPAYYSDINQYKYAACENRLRNLELRLLANWEFAKSSVIVNQYLLGLPRSNS